MTTLSKCASIPFTRRVLPGLLLAFTLFLRQAAAEPVKLILVLGDDSYIPTEAVKDRANAEIKGQLWEHDLLEFAVLVFSNVPYDVLPWAVRDRLPDFLNRGGSLLITGGPNSYGSGGYQPLASIIPLEIRTSRDWVSVPFKAVIPLQPAHPILEEVTFRTMMTFNDLNPKKSGAVEIAQYAGGATFHASGRIFGARFPSPLIAEQRVGQGTVLAVAFDLGREIGSGWADGPRFVENILTYLTQRSPLTPRAPTDLSQMFFRWQEACDQKLRRGLAGGAHWKSMAADCRRELAEVRYPYMDLVDLWLAKRLTIAKRVGGGELSEGEGVRQIKELAVRIRLEIKERRVRAE